MYKLKTPLFPNDEIFIKIHKFTKINDNSRIYVCLHSTRSYGDSEYDKYFNVLKYLIVGKSEKLFLYLF